MRRSRDSDLLNEYMEVVEMRIIAGDTLFQHRRHADIFQTRSRGVGAAIKPDASAVAKSCYKYYLSRVHISFY